MVTKHFYKSLRINTKKTWGATDDSNKMDKKNPNRPKKSHGLRHTSRAQHLHWLEHVAQAQHLPRNFSRTPSILYIDPIYIVLCIIQLKISQKLNYTSAPPLHKMIKFMGYKYTMNPSSQRFTISAFLIFLAYIF